MIRVLGHSVSQTTEHPLLHAPQEDLFQPLAEHREEERKQGEVHLLPERFLEASLLLSPPRNAGRIQSGFFLSTPLSLCSLSLRCLHPSQPSSSQPLTALCSPPTSATPFLFTLSLCPSATPPGFPAFLQPPLSCFPSLLCPSTTPTPPPQAPFHAALKLC